LPFAFAICRDYLATLLVIDIAVEDPRLLGENNLTAGAFTPPQRIAVLELLARQPSYDAYDVRGCRRFLRWGALSINRRSTF
jgi:hypothetical protein